ncbi:MAG TPA: hypothetical protein VL995_07675 [Cellvibrio sp.]|nr:hypothetical protein [Cellvibrio sp.]
MKKSHGNQRTLGQLEPHSPTFPSIAGEPASRAAIDSKTIVQEAAAAITT